MSYVDFITVPVADPVGGFVLPGKDFLIGVQEITGSFADDALCAITLVPLNQLDRVGALVWARRDDEKAVEWKFVCLADEHKPGASGKLHLFDFDSIKGFVESEKEFSKCPMCKRGSQKKAFVSQEQVTFTEDLLLKRQELMGSAGARDPQLCLYYEIQIAKQIISNGEKENLPACISIIKNWTPDIVHHHLTPLLELCVSKDSAVFFFSFLDLHLDQFPPHLLTHFLEVACWSESTTIFESLLDKYFPVVSPKCFENLIRRRNEYLIDALLDYYQTWSTTRAKADMLFRSQDWLELAKFAVQKCRFGYFLTAVQSKGVYALVSQVRLVDPVTTELFVEAGIHSVASPQEDPGLEWDEHTMDDDDDAWE